MRIGVLTGGGDCPGLNAAIRAVVRRSLEYGFEVMGIKNGWGGLVKGDMEPMDMYSVSGILHIGGTVLGSSRTNLLKSEDLMQRALANIESNGLNALVAIGGDDTLSVAHGLWKRGIPTVGIPKTMDNDVVGTDQCIGFDSATSVVASALDNLHTTASSHHRVMVVEVMGRDAGWVAVVGGLAGGADYILIPEETRTVEEVCKHLERRRGLGKDHSIIVIAEGVTMPELTAKAEVAECDAFGHVRLEKRSVGEHLAQAIEEASGIETRFIVLGHLQRGGSPTVADRVLATRYGVNAVDYVREGRFGYITALRGRDIVPVSLDEVVGRTKLVDVDLYHLAQLFY
jgi:ATP-dependent phosphofructokinase / diphosphate-dependent phosphofructokinase